MKYPWQVTQNKVENAIQKIVSLFHPRKIYLFGSYINGNMDKHSDLDLLIVVGDEIKNERYESVRIRRALKDHFIPMDILVISESKFEDLKNIPGLIYREIYQNGKIVYEL